MTSTLAAASTPFAQLVDQLAAAADYNPNDVSPPAAVLWPDERGEWAPMIHALRERLPQLFTLGAYDPATRTGPAIWLKCAVAGTLPDVGAPDGAVPILYLPGVSLKHLRAVEDCKREHQPLAELQYRGRAFAQVNGRDLTVLAFLTSNTSLGFDVAGDGATLEAMKRALPKLMRLPLGELAGRRLDAKEFDEIVTGGDSEKQILRWLDQTVAAPAPEPDEWAAFRSVCKKDYGFDPEHDGRIGAAERLGKRAGRWGKVWERYAEAPRNYAGVPDELRKARPTGNAELFGGPTLGSWPQDNEQAEQELRAALLKLEKLPPAQAAAEIGRLEIAHRDRRSWVWSALGSAPLAAALAHLHALSDAVATPVAGTSRDAMADAYRNGAWKTDAAVLEALAAARDGNDCASVRAAVRALYVPWLTQSAERLQHYVQQNPLPVHHADAEPDKIASGTVVLFVDGLRFDVAERLGESMKGRGWAVKKDWRWSALPSVTPTAKPAVSPAASSLDGGYMGQDFSPNVAQTGKPLTTHAFRQILGERGVPYLKDVETGDPKGSAWTELGDLDGYGHEQGWKLSWRIPEVLSELQGRVAELFAAGWKRVRIVTDHGWLLVPGGLPKTELPGYVAEARWARCAALKSGATPNVPTVPWYWNPNIQMAVASGVSAFVANVEYAHGGVSLQECVTPVLEVTSGASAVRRVAIDSVKWVQLRCKVVLSGEVDDCTVDLRTQAANAGSSLAQSKPATAGEVSLLVGDDEHEGSAAVVVVLDETGTVIAKHATTVGDQ